MNNSANNAQFWTKWQWNTILHKQLTSVRIMYNLLSVFGGNFVLAKVSLGLISVHCTELKSVHISEVEKVKSSGASELSTVKS